jgi:hypothetical protein
MSTPVETALIDEAKLAEIGYEFGAVYGGMLYSLRDRLKGQITIVHAAPEFNWVIAQCRRDQVAAPSAALFPDYDRERRRQTHDGVIWPLARHDMRNATAIRERMSQDLSRLLAERGKPAVVTTEDYLRLGWNREQVEKHGLAASRLIANPVGAGENHCGNDDTLGLVDEVAGLVTDRPRQGVRS